MTTISVDLILPSSPSIWRACSMYYCILWLRLVWSSHLFPIKTFIFLFNDIFPDVPLFNMFYFCLISQMLSWFFFSIYLFCHHVLWLRLVWSSHLFRLKHLFSYLMTYFPDVPLFNMFYFCLIVSQMLSWSSCLFSDPIKILFYLISVIRTISVSWFIIYLWHLYGIF